MTDDAFVDHVTFTVGTGAGNRTGIKHLVAHLEQTDVTAYGLDHPRHVPPQYLGCARVGLCVLPHLGVDRVHGDSLDLHQQVSRPGDRFRQFNILQGLRVLNGQRMVITDSFHGGIL